jgi:hypothetical protein
MEPELMMRRILSVAAIAALLVAVPSAGRAAEPLRSGTITGWGYTWPAMFSGEARNCQWDEWTFELGLRGVNPECRVWLESGCDPDLAGREPAVTASIVDVGDLADGHTTRTFEWGAPPETDYGGVVVQLWRADCTEIEGSEWRSVNRPGATCCTAWTHHMKRAFVIPRDATWMTVTTNDTAYVRWVLT